jgi:Sec-independent protein translocase protein TatA
MRGALGPYEMLVILGILVLLFSGKTLKQLASEVSEALQRF